VGPTWCSMCGGLGLGGGVVDVDDLVEDGSRKLQ